MPCSTATSYPAAPIFRSTASAAAHFHSCPKKGAGAIARHDLLVNLLVKLARRSGIVAHREPTTRDASGKRIRPDLCLRTHTGDVYSDVSVCSSWSKTSKLSANPVGQREKKKVDKNPVCTPHHRPHRLPASRE